MYGYQQIEIVIDRERKHDGNLKGIWKNNTILEKICYVFQYSYVNLDIFKHQWEIDNIYRQFDIEGNQLRIYSGIIGHPKRNIYDYKSYHVCESNFHEYK